MRHKHVIKDAPEKDKVYRVEFKGEELYDAKVIEYEGGCWAKVQVLKVLPGDKSSMYKEGQEFELKLAYYKLYEQVEQD
jgi:hypothetical protein